MLFFLFGNIIYIPYNIIIGGVNMTFDELKKYYEARANSLSYDFKLRIYRAISWGQAAFDENGLDERFMKLWIAFNALYGSGFTDKKEVSFFLESIITVDKEKVLKNSLMELSQTIKNFIEIPELYEEYWKDENLDRKSREEKASILIERNKIEYKEFIQSGEKANEILENIFYLIYILRNQIFHGSASYDSLENEDTKRKCVDMMERFLPDITEIMINNPNHNWHDVKYKPIKNESFNPITKEEREMAIKVNGWIRKVEENGEYQTPPLSKEQRRILYLILESKGKYVWEKVYLRNDMESILIKMK